MKVVFIYGAPGVGKLTVAKELSKLTGFRVLHNHLINDLVESVLERGAPGFWETVHRYRLELLEHAARARIPGVILTLVYANPDDNPLLGTIIRKVKKLKGKVLFVHLVCEKKELLKRIKHPSRKLFRKVKTHKTLRGLMKRHDIFSDVPYQSNFTVDNTRVSARKAAQLIRKRYSL